MNADNITTASNPDNEDYAGYRNPPQYGKPSDSPAEPLPQPECTQCHGFGTGVVQGAVERLRNDLGMVGASSRFMIDLRTVLEALEAHHR